MRPKLPCAKLTIYIRDKHDEVQKLNFFFKSLKRIFNEEKIFPFKFIEPKSCLEKQENYGSSDYKYICCIGDEKLGIALKISIAPNEEISIIVDYQNANHYAPCIQWHHDLITLLAKENIIDMGIVMPGLEKSKPKWYESQFEPNLRIGKKKFIILSTIKKKCYKDKCNVYSFVRKYWAEMHSDDTVIAVTTKEAYSLLEEAKKTFFSELYI